MDRNTDKFVKWSASEALDWRYSGSQQRTQTDIDRNEMSENGATQILQQKQQFNNNNTK